MIEMLEHRTFSGFSSFGFGLPPGTILHNKIGDAYDTVEDIAQIILPNGKELILAAYSDGYEPLQPGDYDISNLGYFAELVIKNLNLDAGNPPQLIYTIASTSNFKTVGDWTKASTDSDKYGDSYIYKNGVKGGNSIAAWFFNVPTDGIYEVAIWWPEGIRTDRSAQVTITVTHADGNDGYTVSMRSRGGRWVKLDDLNFTPSKMGKIEISDNVPDAPLHIMANAVKITQWPSCNGIPGAVCPKVIK